MHYQKKEIIIRFALLKAVKEDNLPKDTVIMSILETSSAKLVKTLTEVADVLKDTLAEKEIQQCCCLWNVMQVH